MLLSLLSLVFVKISPIIGYTMDALISVIGFRFLSYFRSFFFHWPAYRQREDVTTTQLQQLASLPSVKIQITTRGSEGSTEVIRRGIQYVMLLAQEAPTFYCQYLSIEVVTENAAQKILLEEENQEAPLPVTVVVMPKDYRAPHGTQLKARGLHYMVELRRQGFNQKSGRTMIVHYDEESVMEPCELKRLLHYLATTDKSLTEGPIYYPFEYTEASLICRAMEANRPIGCFECREVMEKGVPLHLHGSNLVIDEALENELGWDIGTLDGQPFIAEDYVFGVQAYLRYGSSIFGWHGCLMLEQPPFSFTSAFRQRYRWIIGVLQGLAMMQRLSAFQQMPWSMRLRLQWGTRYRIATFALGLPAGVISFFFVLYQGFQSVFTKQSAPLLPLPFMVWLSIIGFLWLNSIFIGAWANISLMPQGTTQERIGELAKVLAVAPLAGVLESTAAFWAVLRWSLGKRTVHWQPTPKTGRADKHALAKGEVVA